MEFTDPNSSSSYCHHQPSLPHFYESPATNLINLHQSQPVPPPYSSASAAAASSSFPYQQNPNPNPNPFPSFQNAFAYGVDSFSYGIVATGNPVADLETKRQKVIAGGAPPDSVRICTICNVVCNSDKVFAFHLAGEKHALKAFGVPSNPLKVKTPTYMKALHSTNKATHPAKTRAAKTATKKASRGLVSFVRSAYCDVCKIDCQSQDVLSNHKLGRKHMKNLQKLQESITPKPANAPAKVATSNSDTSASQSKAVNEQLQKNIGPAAKEDTSASQSKTVNEQLQKNNVPAAEEDLETKKQKVLSGGAASDAVRVCTCCNVVCNSDLVYNFHIAGKKHAAMVKKQLQQQQQQQQAALVS